MNKKGRFTVSGAEVLQIKASEVLKTDAAKRQIKWLKKIKIR